MNKKWSKYLTVVSTIGTIGSFIFTLAIYIGLLPSQLSIPISGQSIDSTNIFTFTVEIPLLLISIVLIVIFILPIIYFKVIK